MSPSQRWFFGPGEAGFYTAVAGKLIFAKLVNGEQMEAVLAGVDTYHLVLRRRDGVTVLLPKHSVLYVLTRDPVPTPGEGEDHPMAK